MTTHHAFLAFKYYLYNSNCVILSDCKPLKNINKSYKPVGITTQSLMKLSEYLRTFKHIPSTTNLIADYLSRYSFEINQETFYLTQNYFLKIMLCLSHNLYNDNETPYILNCLISSILFLKKIFF